VCRRGEMRRAGSRGRALGRNCLGSFRRVERQAHGLSCPTRKFRPWCSRHRRDGDLLVIFPGWPPASAGLLARNHNSQQDRPAALAQRAGRGWRARHGPVCMTASMRAGLCRWLKRSTAMALGGLLEDGKSGGRFRRQSPRKAMLTEHSQQDRDLAALASCLSATQGGAENWRSAGAFHHHETS